MNVARCHVSPSRMDMNMGWPRQAKIVAPPLSFFPSPILGYAFQGDAPWSWDIHGSYPKDLFCFVLGFELVLLVFQNVLMFWCYMFAICGVLFFSLCGYFRIVLQGLLATWCVVGCLFQVFPTAFPVFDLGMLQQNKGMRN